MNQGSAEVRLDIPVEAAWRALVSPGPRLWYFQLTPEGTFREGESIRWTDRRGNLAEESEVIEVAPPRRLATRTRFMFAPAFAEEPAHKVIWDITPYGEGCRVTMSWQADDIVGGMLASEAQNVLDGMQLEHDPAARAGLARIARIGDVEVRDVSPDRVDDYQEFFDHHAFRDFPAWRSCYCMETHRTSSDEEWAVRTAADNRRDMTAAIQDGGVTALLAYVDGKPVGWCNYGDTTALYGVMHRFKLDVADHVGVGSIACFVVAAPYRKHGVAARLLEAAVTRLRQRGVNAIEAYPVKDPADLPQANYRGPLSMYLRAGFDPYREHGHYQIVRKNL